MFSDVMDMYLERWEHFSLFFSVDRIVVVLHGNEWRELVVNSVVLHDVDC